MSVRGFVTGVMAIARKAELNLGPDTAAIARGIELFNPDGSWKKA